MLEILLVQENNKLKKNNKIKMLFQQKKYRAFLLINKFLYQQKNLNKICYFLNKYLLIQEQKD